MSWDFILDPHPCKRCGKIMTQPGELHLGTGTGLCYACQRAPMVVLKVHTLDGAKLKEYPPHSPSWRRDRESFIAYDDCPNPKCKGQGREYVSRWPSEGGSYYISCQVCRDRFWDQPRRKEHQEYLNSILDYPKLMAEYNDKFVQAAISELGLEPVYKGKVTNKKKPINFVPPIAGSEKAKALQALCDKYYAEFNQVADSLRQQADDKFPDVVEDRIGKEVLVENYGKEVLVENYGKESNAS